MEQVKKEENVVLPMTILPITQINPQLMIIFSKPKVGKSSLFAKLEKNLIFDTEKGTSFIEALKVKIESVADIKKYGSAILKAGKPYSYITIDTMTALEDLLLPYAEELYSKTPIGSKWFTEGKPKYGNITSLPQGQGYNYTRQAMDNVLKYIKTLADTIILSVHVKDSMLEKNGTDVNVLDLDLVGKMKRILASQSDAIGYLHRKGNQNILSFKTTDEIACGARSPHLSNKEIVISEKQEDGSLVTYWDQIFLTSK